MGWTVVCVCALEELGSELRAVTAWGYYYWLLLLLRLPLLPTAQCVPLERKPILCIRFDDAVVKMSETVYGVISGSCKASHGHPGISSTQMQSMPVEEERIPRLYFSHISHLCFRTVLCI